jgi:hypothetical protein
MIDSKIIQNLGQVTIVLGKEADSYGENDLEDVLPHLARDAETKLEVVRKVVFLHLPQVCR